MSSSAAGLERARRPWRSKSYGACGSEGSCLVEPTQSTWQVRFLFNILDWLCTGVYHQAWPEPTAAHAALKPACTCAGLCQSMAEEGSAAVRSSRMSKALAHLLLSSLSMDEVRSWIACFP